MKYKNNIKEKATHPPTPPRTAQVQKEHKNIEFKHTFKSHVIVKEHL